MSLLLEFWELIVGGVAVLAAVFFRQQAKSAKKRADRAEWVAAAHEEMRNHEREAMQMDDTTLADRLTRR